MRAAVPIAALAAALVAGNAAAADWTCQGEAADWPGVMTVVLTVSDQGRLQAGQANLRLGGAAFQLPFAVLGYDLERPGSPRLGPVSNVAVGAMIDAERPPRSKTAHIELIVEGKVWSRPWELYARRQWEDEGAAGFFGMIPSEAKENGLGKAIEGGEFLIIRVIGDEGGEMIATRQQALPSRTAVQPLADAAHAKALAASRDFRNACEVVKHGK